MKWVVIDKVPRCIDSPSLQRLVRRAMERRSIVELPVYVGEDFTSGTRTEETFKNLGS